MSKIKRILIANRGEIAIRIAKAANELGHVSVGFWTDNEPKAYHLEFCKEWVHLPGDNISETFLNIERIAELAKAYKIDAIHPGYGFLAENSNFVRRVEKEGIIFIGPNAEAIDLMGDKAKSKKIARDAGVPTVPGSDDIVENLKDAKELTMKMGYPVLLKAVAGGGGKGMRICLNDSDLEKNFDAVKREGASSFGNPDLLIEKYILDPRHIEVQILADKNKIYHVYERECSIQRRHQKVVEESPSPFIGDDQELREKICKTAIDLARAVNYDSAGTVEFIMDADRSFYFLEMNTRIQVEHPITEEVTGVDLLTNMIKSAFGESLDIKSQEEITQKGHAIECRICAEDPISMLPAPGIISGFSYQLNQGVRFDHCIYPGVEITPDFDPMIGKLITFGLNREVAIRKMEEALKHLKLVGLKSNIELLKVIINEKSFRAGQYSTKYIEMINPQESLKKRQLDDESFLSVIMSELISKVEQ